MAMGLAARVLTPNCRNENAMELFPSRRWSRRRPYLITSFGLAPSVIGVQGSRTVWRQITQVLGPNSTFWDPARPR